MSEPFIVNAHEHLESIREVPRYLEIMQKTGITKTVLVGSPNYTIYLNQRMGFDKYHENNLQILKTQREYPDKFFAFVALNPEDKDNERRLEEYLVQGARGIKLYYGLGVNHGKGPFHSVSIDYAGMDPVFKMCRALDLPIIFHINRVSFYEELLRFLKKHPKLKVCFPHFMVSLKTPYRLGRVARLLSLYPNIYTDCAYGRDVLLLPVAKHITNRHAEFRTFFKTWSSRILFGTDLVITRVKLENWGNYVEQMTRWYRALLETSYYAVNFKNGRYVLRGLNLSPDFRDNIYYRNFARFVSSKVYHPDFG